MVVVNTASAAFTVNPLPTISISASSTSICAGDSVTLTASGTSYLWGGGQTANPLTVTPELQPLILLQEPR